MKRNCRWVSDRLAGYREGWLEEDERRAVERHLAECPACTEDLEADARLATALSEQRPVETPDLCWSDVRVRAGIAERRPSAWRLGWAVPVAAALALYGVWLSLPRSSMPAAAPVAVADEAPRLDDAFLLSSSIDAAGDPHRVLLALQEAGR